MVEKTISKNRRRSMIQNIMLEENSGSHGIAASKSFKEKSSEAVRLVAVGVCPKCGKRFIRPDPCTTAVCDCSSITDVPLHRAEVET